METRSENAGIITVLHVVMVLVIVALIVAYIVIKP
jgi:hypothetical protein